MQNFITTQELIAMGITIDEDSSKISALITYVSAFLRQIARNNGVDIDKRIEEDPNYKTVVEMVVVNAVQRGSQQQQAYPDATIFSQAANPYSETVHFSDAVQNAYFKKKELELLGLGSIGGRPQIAILNGVR